VATLNAFKRNARIGLLNNGDHFLAFRTLKRGLQEAVLRGSGPSTPSFTRSAIIRGLELAETLDEAVSSAGQDYRAAYVAMNATYDFIAGPVAHGLDLEVTVPMYRNMDAD